MQKIELDTAYCEELYCRCIVCENFSGRSFRVVNGLRYRRCQICKAVFMAPSQRLSAEAEYALYCQHHNDPDDSGYRRFLTKFTQPLLKKLPRAGKGLDFGCGPGPALAGMLNEAGHQIRLFDVFFFPDPAPLEDSYDFITCTETIEHLYQPAETFACFDRLLKPGGWLALMTCFLTDENRFANWHYRRDPTHVVFYRAETLRHLASRFRWNCEIPCKDVALMQKRR